MTIVQQALDIIQKKMPDLQAVYLFGSTGSQHESNDSDLDIAVLVNKKIEASKIWEIAKEIALAIKRDVDLIDLKNASTLFQIEIITSGERIFCQDPIGCDLFETSIYSQYVHLNDERKELLEDIKKRGGQILNG